MLRAVALLACLIPYAHRCSGYEYGSLVDTRALNHGDFGDARSREGSTGTNLTAEFELDSRSLEARLQCPNSQWYDCYGKTCCPYGLWCVESGCCRPGQKNCGSKACYPEATHYCCTDDYDGACKFGEDCVEGAFCCPSGQKRCGQKCYPPDEAKCCQRGGDSWPCWSAQACGEEAGSCEECPIPTRTVTTTTKFTTTSTITSTITSVAVDEGGWYPEFTCLPVTVTNAEGAVLELGDDCAFSFQPPPETSSGNAKRGAVETKAPDAANAALRARQDCVPQKTATTTVVSTIPVITRTTTTTTVTVAPSDESFSCPEMAVTNTAGDELSLGDDCSLELTLADGEESSEGGDGSSDSNSSDSGSGSGGDGNGDAGGSGNNNGTDPNSSVGGNRNNLGTWWCFALFFALSLLAL